jgi:uncharacterized protein (TIGR02266 family)
MPNSDEAIVTKRRSRPAQVAITIDDMSEHNFWADITMDVERGGVFVATYHPLSLGTSVELELVLREHEPAIDDRALVIEATGVVRWARAHHDGSDAPAGVGIKFVHLAPEVLPRVRRFVETVRPPLVFELDEAPMRRRRGSPSVPPDAGGAHRAKGSMTV